MGDKGFAVGFLAGGFTELHFPGGQGADDAQPGLGDDDGDEEQVDAAEPAVADPLPFQKPAQQGKY